MPKASPATWLRPRTPALLKQASTGAHRASQGLRAPGWGPGPSCGRRATWSWSGGLAAAQRGDRLEPGLLRDRGLGRPGRHLDNEGVTDSPGPNAEPNRKRLTLRQRDLIIDALTERGATNPCPRCGNHDFSVADGLFAHGVQSDLQSFSLGGETIPVAVTVCVRCGYVSEHAMGVLDLLHNPTFTEAGKDSE